uniref:KxDL domain-containing protein n=1 Tax=Panagrellus redivivus TaxID=6233 RepID=A0A7E4VYJ4_PANRE
MSREMDSHLARALFQDDSPEDGPHNPQFVPAQPQANIAVPAQPDNNAVPAQPQANNAVPVQPQANNPAQPQADNVAAPHPNAFVSNLAPFARQGPPQPRAIPPGYTEQYWHALHDAPPLPATPLSTKLERFTNCCDNLMGSLSPSGSALQPSQREVDTSAKFEAGEFTKVATDLSNEFTRTATRWQMRHPQEAFAAEAKELKKDIARQKTLLRKAAGAINKATHP